MNRHSTPGSNVFGPSFFQVAWSAVEPNLLALLHGFHSRSAHLDRNNQAFLVLLPKPSKPNTPSGFRLISLQNCSIKVITKTLSIRLQRQISTLVDVDQIGFLRGRSISENFVYTTELIQCCHKRRAPTIVLKLGFAKVFDSVNCDSLLCILRARGFPNLWCTWMEDLFQSSKHSRPTQRYSRAVDQL